MKNNENKIKVMILKVEEEIVCKVILGVSGLEHGLELSTWDLQ